MSRHSFSSFALAIVLLTLGDRRFASAQDECSLCTDGSAITILDGDVAGVTCEQISMVIGSTPASSPDCQSIQLEAFRNCGCPTYPEDAFCPMCPDASSEIANPMNKIPTLDDKFCKDSLFQRVDDDDESICEDIQRVGYYCGCPNAPPPVCQFCTDDDDTNSTVQQRQASSPQPSMPNRLLPPSFTMTCRELSTIISFGKSETECDATVDEFPLDPRLYCGCSSSTSEGALPVDPPVCSVCPQGEVAVENPDNVVADLTTELSCAFVLNELAPLINDAAYCTSTFQPQFAPACCGTTTTNPSSPSMAPVEANGAGTGASFGVASTNAFLIIMVATTTTGVLAMMS